MANLLFTWEGDVSHDANARTVVQFLVATNYRALLHGIDIMPLGATPASTPLKWHFGVQTTGGTAVDGSADLEKMTPQASQTLQTTCRKTFSGAEPTLSTPVYPITLHQQGTMRQWKPMQPIVMEAGERWALWYDSGQSSLDVRYLFYLEE